MSARVEEIAWELLEALNRLQARGSRLRIVVPRDPEVARELGLDDPDNGAILVAQDWLEYRRYISRTDIGLSVETFTITPEGLNWIRYPFEKARTGERREDERRLSKTVPRAKGSVT